MGLWHVRKSYLSRFIPLNSQQELLRRGERAPPIDQLFVTVNNSVRPDGLRVSLANRGGVEG
jgi:hypothetical protein